MKLNPRLPWQKQHSTGRKFFHQQIGLQFKEEFSAIFGAWFFYCAETSSLGKYIRNAWKVLQYGAVEGWRGSAGTIVGEINIT